MNPELADELYFFALCIIWGGLVLLAYDFLRVIRRLIKHGNLWLAAEDLIFWFIAGILIFIMIYRQNNGIIRGFAVMGMTAGMLLYNLLVGDRLVNLAVKLIRIIIKPFAAVLRLIRMRLARMERLIKNILKVLLKQLKLVCKSIKMKISRTRQKKLQKRQGKQRKHRRKEAESGPEPTFSRISEEELKQILRR